MGIVVAANIHFLAGSIEVKVVVLIRTIFAIGLRPKIGIRTFAVKANFTPHL